MNSNPHFGQQQFGNFPQQNYPNQGVNTAHQQYPTMTYGQQYTTGNPQNIYLNSQTQESSGNAPKQYGDFLNNMPPMISTLGGDIIKNQTLSWYSSFSTFFLSLKVYFAVTNSYVLRKLLTIVYPFNNETWMRLPAEEVNASSPVQGAHKFALPRDDLNAPDLYIPLMSFTTYILLVGLVKGVGGAGFTPELLIQTVWRCLFLQLMETSVIFIFLSLKQIRPPFLDIIAYTGYKYVGLSFSLIGRLLGFYIHFFISIYVSTMLGIFVIMSFRSVVPKSANLGPPNVYIQLACGGLQFFVILVLCLL